MSVKTTESYQTFVYDFLKFDILVECPKCNKKAVVSTNGEVLFNTHETDVKLICPNCGFNKKLLEKPSSVVYSSPTEIIQGRNYVIGGAIDPYFHVNLWLTSNCCGNLLWAYNFEHLDFLEKHIEAKLRERNGQEYANKSLGSRLPKWISSQKNRTTLLKSIGELRNKIS